MSVGFAQRSEVLIDDEDNADTAATTTTTTFKRKRSKDYLRYIVIRPRIRRTAPSLSFFLSARRIRTTKQTDSFRELMATTTKIATSIPEGCRGLCRRLLILVLYLIQLHIYLRHTKSSHAASSIDQ